MSRALPEGCGDVATDQTEFSLTKGVQRHNFSLAPGAYRVKPPLSTADDHFEEVAGDSSVHVVIDSARHR